MKSKSVRRTKRSAITVITAFAVLASIMLAVFLYCDTKYDRTQNNATASSGSIGNPYDKYYTVLSGPSAPFNPLHTPIKTTSQLIRQSALLLNNVEPVEYTVVFKNYDGTVLSTTAYQQGAAVELPADPTRPADAQYTYTFASWDKEVVAATEDVTYTATYTSTVNKYTVTWVVGEQSFSEQVAYGSVPTFTGSTDKAADSQYFYTFAGWDKEVVAVTEDVTYTATYTATPNVHTVTWVVGEQSFSEQVSHGSVPVFSGSTDKAEDSQYVYTFAGWDKEVVAITEDVTYTATYTQIPKEYTIIFKNYDDSVLLEKNYAYGQTIILPEDPTHPDDQEGTFVFTGWLPLVPETCTESATYIAVFERGYFFGDANGDAKVTISDLLVIKMHIMDKKFLSEDSVIIADMTGDGKITITDFLRVKDIILGKGSITA